MGTKQEEKTNSQMMYAEVVRNKTYEDNKKLRQGLNKKEIGTVEFLKKEIIGTSNR